MSRFAPRARLLSLLACACALSLIGTLASLARPAATPHTARGALDSVARFLPADPQLQAKEFAFIHAGGLFHLFFMRRWPDSLGETNLRSFGHAVSTDLRTWTELDSVLAVQPGAWDGDHVWSPSMIQRGGTWYMFYTGVKDVPYGWPWFQQIGVATSTDLLNWTHYDTPVLNGSMVSWTRCDSSDFWASQFRDAFVMPDPTDASHWLMYYVTIPTGFDQLIVGVARNAGGLTAWNDIGPLWCTDRLHHYGWSESPVLLQHGSLWYMFMTTNAPHCLRYSVTPDPLADSTQWSGPFNLFDNAAQDTVSDAWFGPEVLSVDGHDYLAFVDSNDGSVGFREILWGSGATDFTLANPGAFDSVPPAAPPSRLALAALGQPGSGPRVMFRIASPAATTGRLEIYDLAGRRLGTVRSGPLGAGDSYAEWDGRAGGVTAAAGIYLARLSSPLGTRTVRLAITR